MIEIIAAGACIIGMIAFTVWVMKKEQPKAASEALEEKSVAVEEKVPLEFMEQNASVLAGDSGLKKVFYIKSPDKQVEKVFNTKEEAREWLKGSMQIFYKRPRILRGMMKDGKIIERKLKR